jgi:hypothetical protein
MDSDSLCVLKCVIALNGTGVCTRVVPVLVLLDPPALEELEVLLREVPLKDVFALEEMLVEVLALDKTVAFVAAVEDGDSAEVDVTLLDRAEVEPMLFGDSADEDDAEDPTPAVEEGVNMAFPVEGATPDPAPDDEPAVFDAVAFEVLLVEEDWM